MIFPDGWRFLGPTKQTGEWATNPRLRIPTAHALLTQSVRLGAIFPHSFVMPHRWMFYDRMRNPFNTPFADNNRPKILLQKYRFEERQIAQWMRLKKARKKEFLTCSMSSPSTSEVIVESMVQAVSSLLPSIGEASASISAVPTPHNSNRGGSGQGTEPQAMGTLDGQVPPPGCPMHNPHVSVQPVAGINPLNHIPPLSQEPAPGQAVALPKERETSNIPGPAGNWVYPSEQMFFNAMRRKGWQPEEADMRAIVRIHNTTNERTWSLLSAWEKELHSDSCPAGPRLLRFRGRPEDLSPKARLLSLFGYRNPFDRHDWIVDRCGKEVRYIIDYYDGEFDKKTGKLGMHLDVRPAVDDPLAIFDRLRMWWRGGVNAQTNFPSSR